LNIYLGEERYKRSYQFKDLLVNKAILAFGSDWFVAPPNPIVAIDAAVNRNIDGEIFLPE